MQLNGQTKSGYVMSSFLSSVDPTAQSQTFNSVTRFTVRVAPSRGVQGYVNFRSGPSTSSAQIRRLYKGETLTVVAESNAWYRVFDANGVYGYVAKAYVTK